jgi:hypothetical protein
MTKPIYTGPFEGAVGIRVYIIDHGDGAAEKHFGNV